MNALQFELGARPGHIVLTAGPRTIYYSRQTHYAFQFGHSSAEISGPTDDERIEYLAALTGSTGLPFPLRANASAAVAWRGAEDLIKRAAELRQDVEMKYQWVLTTLVERKKLTPADADRYRVPRITMTVVDLREDRSQPLPAIARD